MPRVTRQTYGLVNAGASQEHREAGLALPGSPARFSAPQPLTMRRCSVTASHASRRRAPKLLTNRADTGCSRFLPARDSLTPYVARSCLCKLLSTGPAPLPDRRRRSVSRVLLSFSPRDASCRLALIPFVLKPSTLRKLFAFYCVCSNKPHRAQPATQEFQVGIHECGSVLLRLCSCFLGSRCALWLVPHCQISQFRGHKRRMQGTRSASELFQGKHCSRILVT